MESIEPALESLINTLRKGQKALTNWKGGQMAISAVPGAGKSHSLAIASVVAIAQQQLHAQKQLIIVTLTRSACVNIKTKIRDHLIKLNLPQSSFQVFTIHSLAFNIARQNPQLTGINVETATLINPTKDHPIIRQSINQWLKQNSPDYQLLLKGEYFDGEETEKLRRHSVLKTEILPELAYTIIREAKSSGLSPDELIQLGKNQQNNYPILTIAGEIYHYYETLLKEQNLMDYNDMIISALKVLNYPTVCQQWQDQIFAIFEDEAQDSSPLQEKLITILASNNQTPEKKPNLIRVGDPNQAINSTFTPADPLYFNSFCETCNQDKTLATMNEAGRSCAMIIKVANYSLKWVNDYWKKNKIHSIDSETNPKFDLPFREQMILPVAEDDPQESANPSACGKGVEIYQPIDVYQSVQFIGKKALKLLLDNPSHNAAILVRQNKQGHFIYEQLAPLFQDQEVELYDIGKGERNTQIPTEILKLLQFIDRPHSRDYLKETLEVLQERELIPVQDLGKLCVFPEQFLYPTLADHLQTQDVMRARDICRSILDAKLKLTHYQLIPFLGMKLNYSGIELATIQKLSEQLEKKIKGYPTIPLFINTLTELINSERFESIEEDTDNRYTRQKQLTIITMHKAKGLDWDYVFIPFLQKDTIPGSPYIRKEHKFLGNFNLHEVGRVQLRHALHYHRLKGNYPPLMDSAESWTKAEDIQLAEAYRLLYVAMTRTKRLLCLLAEDKAPFSWPTFCSLFSNSSSLESRNLCPLISALEQQFPQLKTQL